MGGNQVLTPSPEVKTATIVAKDQRTSAAARFIVLASATVAMLAALPVLAMWGEQFGLSADRRSLLSFAAAGAWTTAGLVALPRCSMSVVARRKARSEEDIKVKTK